MFLLESYRNSQRSSEPKPFRDLRNIVAASFSLAFFFYVVNVLLKFRNNSYRPNIFISENLVEYNEHGKEITKESFTYPGNNLL